MRISVTFIVLLSFITASSLFSEGTTGRKAIIVDSSGTSSEISGLQVTGNDGWIACTLSCFKNPYADSPIVIETSPIYIAIRSSTLVSVDILRDTWSVSYLRSGEKRNISGKVSVDSSIIGDGDFGKYEIGIAKVKKLSFEDTAAASQDEKAFTPDSVIILRNGKKLPSSNLRRVAWYFSTAGYLIGGADAKSETEDIRFLLGDSKQSVDFAKIDTIGFSKNPNTSGETVATITLKDGKKASGRVPGGEDGIFGFHGDCDNGEYFVELKDVSMVRFSPGSPAE